MTHFEHIDQYSYNKYFSDILMSDESGAKCHVEIQDSDDRYMALRMFRYSLEIAEEDKI